MVGEPVQIEVRELVWQEGRADHVASHGVSRDEVEEVLHSQPRFFRNERGPGLNLMLGPQRGGRFLYVVIAPTRQHGVWSVITAYRYNRRRALRHYREG